MPDFLNIVVTKTIDMKLKLLSTFALSISMLALNAQMEMPSTLAGAEQNTQKAATPTPAIAAQTVTKAESNTKPSLGPLLSQFSGQISPGALTDEFSKEKSGFQSQASATTDVKGTSGLLQKLEGGLKSSAFSAGWAKIRDKWLGNVKTATTTKQLAGYLKTLSENVDPKFLGANWEKIKPTFTAALDKIAQ